MQKWTSQITPDLHELAIAQWNSAIQDIPDDFLRRGLKDCAVKFDWPPSIKEFRELCLSYHSKYLDVKKVVAPRIELTPEQEEKRKKVAREHMNKIWAILKKPDRIVNVKTTIREEVDGKYALISNFDVPR